jgi:hypothetical protein
MTWEEFGRNLLDFEGHQLLIQVAERRGATDHMPVLTTIGRLGGPTHRLEQELGKDAISLGVTTAAGETSGAIMLREADFENAERRDDHLLVVAYGGLDVFFALRDRLR